MSENIYTTKNGTELTLKAVPEVGLQTLLFGFVSDFHLPKNLNPQQLNEKVREHFGDKQNFNVQAQTLKLVNYVVSFGVVNEPPEDAVVELRVLGFEVNTAITRKRNWLMMLVLDNDDIPELMQRVITLTYGNKLNPGS